MNDNIINKRKQIIQDLSSYLVLTQKQLKYQLTTELFKYYNKVKMKDGFVFARGNLPIMLVAHMDTVHTEQVKKNDIFANFDYSIINSPKGIGGDDRCGVYMIMNIIKTTDFRPYILFVEDEEIGSVGASKFIERYNKNNLDLDYIIEFDRKGSIDSVYYDLDNKDFENYINGFGFKTAIGSFSDICVLSPALDVASVNLSCGYYQEHTLSHYIVIDEMMATILKAKRMLEKHVVGTKFAWKEIVYQSINHYAGGYPYDTYYYDNKNNYGYGYVCEVCGKEITNWDNCNETEFGEVICEHCAEHYGYHHCKNCGVWIDTYDDLCGDCKRYESYYGKPF